MDTGHKTFYVKDMKTIHCESCNYPKLEPQFAVKLPTGQTICGRCEEAHTFHKCTFEELKRKMWIENWNVEEAKH